MNDEPAIAVLIECESRLRELLADAAKQGDYERVERLAAWAKAVAMIVSAPIAAHQSDSGNGHRSRSPQPRRRRIARTTGRKKAAGNSYPRFARVKDDLVKIGWSKRERQEYQHKAPQRVAMLLVERLIRAGAKAEVFTAEQLLPLRDNETGSDVPTYQAYVCLAWLRDRGLIEQIGRQGYRLVQTENLRKEVEVAWSGLSTRISA